MNKKVFVNYLHTAPGCLLLRLAPAILVTGTLSLGQMPQHGVVRPEVQELLDQSMSDAPYANPAKDDQVFKELASRPDIKPDLWAAFMRDYMRPDRDNCPPGMNNSAIAALASRNDLNAQDLRIITDELTRFVGVPEAAPTSSRYFTNSALLLLRHYPGPEHENLVIKFLDRPAKEGRTLLAASRTLSIIGGPESLAAMKRMIQRVRSKYPDYFDLKEMESHASALESRLKVSPIGKAATSSSAPKASDSSIAGTKAPAIRQIGEAKHSSFWFIMLLMVGIAVAVLFAWNRKQERVRGR